MRRKNIKSPGPRRGLARGSDAGYIAQRLRAGPASWDAYSRLASRTIDGQTILVWHCRHISNGGDVWCRVTIAADGSVICHGQGGDIAVAPAPGTLAAIQPG